MLHPAMLDDVGQCWMMLVQHVDFVSTGLKLAKTLDFQSHYLAEQEHTHTPSFHYVEQQRAQVYGHLYLHCGVLGSVLHATEQTHQNNSRTIFYICFCYGLCLQF